MPGELKHLDEHRAAVLANLCETIVPGSRRVKPVVYIDAIMAEMPVPHATRSSTRSMSSGKRRRAEPRD